MITIKQHLIHSTHGYHTITVPEGAEIIGVSPTSVNGMLGINMKIDNTVQHTVKKQIFVCITGFKFDNEAPLTFLGTCNATHVFKVG